MELFLGSENKEARAKPKDEGLAMTPLGVSTQKAVGRAAGTLDDLVAALRRLSAQLTASLSVPSPPDPAEEIVQSPTLFHDFGFESHQA